ncbi:MAG: hypothetical protein KAH03_02500 [Cocleimonas sp.]|nr:hypothetical protein [Cocleimonas sp.]
MRPLQDIEQLPMISDTDTLEDMIGLDDIDELAKIEEEEEEKKKEKRMKPHIIRRNVEDYLEQKALERSLRDVFDSDYLF